MRRTPIRSNGAGVLVLGTAIGSVNVIVAVCSAIFEWEGLRATQSKVFRIHGKHDLVIPAPLEGDSIHDIVGS